jgi:hypothetical protein
MNMRFDLKYWLKRAVVVAAYLMVLNLFAAMSQAGEGVPPTPVPATADVDIQSTSIRYLEDLDLLVFEQEARGRAGGTPPQARGQLDGAPVLAYVFVTDLDPATVGFGPVEGTLALAVTAHPDFDDTPLWDENVDGNYENDGIVFHSHWVVLVSDERVAGGLSVRQFTEGDESVVLPPTNPGMPIYMDSPGFQVNLRGHRLQVLVPSYRLRHQTSFAFDAVTAYLQVNTSDSKRPMLGVYKVYEILSGDLSLPYKVRKE